MANNRNHQKKRNVFPQKENPLETQKPYTEVRQDKGAPLPGRIASSQPALVKDSTRARETRRASTRSQTSSTHNNRAVKVTVWVKPIVKAELNRVAEQQGLSTRATCAALLEKAMRQELHLQHAVLLQPMIEQAIAREMRTLSTRLVWFLVRVAFDGGQTRSLVTNILGRQPGVTPDILKTILEMSGKTAKTNITRRTPQLVELIEAVETWMMADGEEQEG